MKQKALMADETSLQAEWWCSVTAAIKFSQTADRNKRRFSFRVLPQYAQWGNHICHQQQTTEKVQGV